MHDANKTTMIVHRTRKGEQTRAAILDMARELAGREGLEGLTIGLLADRMGMSKSGVFSHFGSRQELQIAVLELYRAQFEQELFRPDLQEAAGLAHLRAIIERWMKLVTGDAPFGCLYISGAVEYDDRAGALRDVLMRMVSDCQLTLQARVIDAVEKGELSQATDSLQLVFEMQGLILALHHEQRFLRRAGSVDRARAGFQRLIERSCDAVLPAVPTTPTTSTTSTTPVARFTSKTVKRSA